MKINLLIFIILISVNQVFAQLIETDRPDQTEASSTVPKGTVQLESGLGYETFRLDDLGSTANSYTLPTSLFRIALINRLELRIVSTLRFDKQIHSLNGESKGLGIDDIETGFKFQFTEGQGLKPQMALMSHIVIPTGVHSPQTFGTVNKLLISHDLTERLSLGYNLGHAYFGSGKGDFIYSIALGFSLTERMGVYIENYGTGIEFSTFLTNVDGGFTYLVQDNIQLDYSFGFGLNQRMNYQAIGISMRFPK